LHYAKTHFLTFNSFVETDVLMWTKKINIPIQTPRNMAIVNGQWNNHLRFHSSPEKKQTNKQTKLNRRFFENQRTARPNTGWKLGGMGRD
jgi:hypothetical protein